jgi:hypothetical protein
MSVEEGSGRQQPDMPGRVVHAKRLDNQQI